MFTGPFELGVAHAVAAEPGDGRLDVLDALSRLVERSLVGIDSAARSTRYRLLELLREHALVELREAGEEAPVEERFVEAMVAAADGIVAAALQRWDPTMLGAASSQYANLVRACELCLQRDAAPDRAFRLLAADVRRRARGSPDRGVGARGPRP